MKIVIRKLLILILSILISFSLFGCSTNKNNDAPTIVHFPDKKADISEIKMIEVDSSALSHIGYKDGILVVVFTSSYDRCYVYYDVPASVYKELINSESIGKYMNTNIKSVYLSNRIDGVQIKNGYINYIWD